MPRPTGTLSAKYLSSFLAAGQLCNCPVKIRSDFLGPVEYFIFLRRFFLRHFMRNAALVRKNLITAELQELVDALSEFLHREGVLAFN